MKQKFLSFFHDYYKKLILILLLVPLVLLVDQMEFPKIDAFIRDALQYLNSSEGVSKEIVTVNVDTTEFARKPFENKYIIELVTKLQSTHPKSIVILMEPAELHSSVVDRTNLYQFLKSQPNIFLEKQPNDTSFAKDRIFESFPRFIPIPLGIDQTFGAKDSKHRRAILKYDNRGKDNIFNVIRDLGLEAVPISHYKFTYKFWDTQQVFLKSFRAGTFGDYQASKILSNQISPQAFTNKAILIGSFDEFSYLAQPSVFDLFGRTAKDTFYENNFPYQDTIANLLNLYVTGDYIKLIGGGYDLYFVGLLLCLLILSSLSIQRKLYVFLSILPGIFVLIFSLYIASSFYIDFSRSIALLVFLQYFAIPIFMFFLFKFQERKKLEEVNSARIESLLIVSEKVAHDIRSPLSAINLILSRVTFDNHEHKEILNSALKRIDESAGKILLKYKTNGREREPLEPVSIGRILEKIIREKKILDESILYNVKTEFRAEPFVFAHNSELERILSNILDNSIYALKENSKRAEVNFKLYQEEGFLKMEIEDNGIGIEESIINLIGNEKVTTKGRQKGHGIALLHAKNSIEKMGGKLSIESKKAQGTTITIRLRTAP